ncbi:MAG: EVE domain-containing protein [Planctomycetaceae bacterium]|nr:EVE domain-containing protein [Planctomycetaceae bacterium]
MAKRKSAATRKYWLFKSEPSCYSIDDLERDGTTFWDGVRNYQARNMLRDEIQPGDRVLFYHSNADPMAIAGTCEVVKPGYPDHTAFDPASDHYDAKSNPDKPTWFMVDVKLLKKFKQPVTREVLKECEALQDMMLLRKGSRLSIQPVTVEEWQAVHKLAGVKA